MYYCKAGEMFVVNALCDELYVTLYKRFKMRQLFLEALDAKSKYPIQIPHGTIVLTLEGSVPPWYEADQIRCLWNERIVFIRRKALKKLDTNNCLQENSFIK